MKSIHRAWLVCIGCTLLLFCTIGLVSSAFSVYQPYLISDLGLTNAQASSVVTVRNLFALAAMLGVARYYRRLSLRTGAVLAVLGAAASFFLFGIARSFAGCCLSAAVAGTAYGFGGMVPVSLLIGRWFRSRQALALGICSAGTGAATILAPPLLTLLIGRVSLSAAFFAEAGLMALLAVLIFALLRSDPSEQGLAPLGGEPAEDDAAPAKGGSGLNRAEGLRMLAAAAMIGAVANPGFSHLAVLYRSEGIDSMTVSLLLSAMGAALTIGKCLYGQITDHWGAARSGWLFFGLMIAGELLCSLPGGSVSAACVSMLCQGFGLPLGTVGLTVFARDLSAPDAYAATVRHFQTSYLCGALAFGPVPGLLADALGSYLPAYRLLTGFALAAMVLVQGTYLRRGGRSLRPAALRRQGA